jgi:hypothetical protein
MAKNKPVQRRAFFVAHKGQTYRAQYYVESGVVIVDAVSEKGTIERNQAMVGASRPDALAQLLLIEMI